MAKATGGASDWAFGMAVAFQLPGRRDGPADAYRHLLIAAELHRVYPNQSGDWYLKFYEWIFGGSDSDMDRYVNDIGERIGKYVRSQGGDTNDVLRHVNRIMENSFPVNSWRKAKWVKVPEAGYKMTGAVPTRLPNGAVLPPAVVAKTDPKDWEETNPEVFPGMRFPTDSTNVLDRHWQRRFNFSGTTPAKALKYMRKNRPMKPFNPMPLDEHQVP